MLIVLGIAVLAVSFVIALISLVAEERRREKLIEEQEDVPNAPGKAPVPNLDQTNPAAGRDEPLGKDAPVEIAPSGVSQAGAQPWFEELEDKQVKTEPKEEELLKVDEELHPRDARLPYLGPDLSAGSGLRGEIKMDEVAKKQE